MKSQRNILKLVAVLSSMLLASGFIALRSGSHGNAALQPASQRTPVFLPGSKSEEEARQIGEGISGSLPIQP